MALHSDPPNGISSPEPTSETTPSKQPEAQNGIQQPLRTIYPFLELEEHPIDTNHEIRPVSVIVVGSGMGGITAGILLPKKVPGVQLTILEKTSDIVSTAVFPKQKNGQRERGNTNK